MNCCLLMVKKRGHPEWEDTVQRWFNWLYEVKKKDEEKGTPEVGQPHRRLCRRWNGFLAHGNETHCLERRNTNSGGRRRKCQIFGHV